MAMNSRIHDELRRIADAHGGLLRPEDVVQEASAPESPLHASFEWDNNEAGHQWRLHQARMLIRVSVTYEKPEVEPYRVFVSLTPDRTEGNGYRYTEDVLRHQKLRSQLLTDALAELECFERKYARLCELVEVFKAIQSTRERLRENGNAA